jgi:hypothetical protein
VRRCIASPANVSGLVRRLCGILIINPATDHAVLAWRLQAAGRPSDQLQSTPKQVTNCKFNVACGRKRAPAPPSISPRRARHSSLSTSHVTGGLTLALRSGQRTTMPTGQAHPRAPCWFNVRLELPSASTPSGRKLNRNGRGQRTVPAASQVVRVVAASVRQPSLLTACRCRHLLNQRNLADENRSDSPAF